MTIPKSQWTLEPNVQLRQGTQPMGKTPKQDTQEVTVKLQISRGCIWKLMSGKDHISDLRKRLGLEIHVSQNEEITLKGKQGAVQMGKNILEAQIPGIRADPIVIEDSNDFTNGPDAKVTATALAMWTDTKDLI